MTRTSPTSRSTSTVVVSSLLLCAEMKLSTFYSRVWDLFVWQVASKSILPRLLPGNGPGGAMYTRLPCFRAWPILTPNLLLFVSGARWQAVSAYNNYLVTLVTQLDRLHL